MLKRWSTPFDRENVPILLMKFQSSFTATFRAYALIAPALIGLAACKPNASSTNEPKAADAAAPSAPAPASPTASAPAAQPGQATQAPADSAIPANVLEDLLKKAKPPEVSIPLPPVVAIVEGQEIKAEELETALKTVLAGQGIPPEQFPADQKAQGYKVLLNELVTEKLVNSRCKDTVVKDEDLNARIDQLKSRFPSQEAFEQQIVKAGQTIEKLREEIRASLKQQTWIEDQIKDAPKATDADAEDFFKKNPQQFEKPEQVRASHILVSVAQDATAEVAAEKQKAAEAILARAKSGGEAFDKLAAELSEDPSAKQNSGDLNFFAREQMVPEFSKAAFEMKKGEISGPVRSQFGFHIIQVTDRKDAEKMTLDAVKPQLMTFLNRQKHQEQVQNLLKDLREKAQVEIKLP